MKAVYKLNESEIKEQNQTIEKYTKLIDSIKEFQEVEVYGETMKVYTETIKKAKNLINNGILIENDFRINMILKSNRKTQLTILN